MGNVKGERKNEKDHAGLYCASNFLISPFSFLLSQKMPTFARNLTKHNPYMAQKPSIPKGTRDFGFVEMAKRN